jgi:hypothetical protein
LARKSPVGRVNEIACGIVSTGTGTFWAMASAAKRDGAHTSSQ